MMTPLRRRQDDENPTPAWITQLVRLALPTIVGALSAYAGSMLALDKADAVKSEQIRTIRADLEAAHQESLRHFDSIKADVKSLNDGMHELGERMARHEGEERGWKR